MHFSSWRKLTCTREKNAGKFRVPSFWAVFGRKMAKIAIFDPKKSQNPRVGDGFSTLSPGDSR